MNTHNTHGTGCTLSSAIAATAARAGIAPGGIVPEHVVVEARNFLHRLVVTVLLAVVLDGLVVLAGRLLMPWTRRWVTVRADREGAF